MGKKLDNIDNQAYKIVMIKMIEEVEPVYYRVVNLSNYETEDVPAYRLIDDIINHKRNIINVQCENNSIVIVNSEGYKSTDEIIIVDEFDNEIPNLYDWALSNNNGIGNKVISTFDVDKNGFSMSNFKVNSKKKIAWTCEKGHTVFCGFPTYFSTGCECFICKNGKTLSLDYWCKVTNNEKILEYYDNAGDKNELYSTDIYWKSTKEVVFSDRENEQTACLADITSGKVKLNFDNTKVILNRDKK